MRTFRNILLRGAALLLLPMSASTFADCVARSAATSPHLIELYTSEGCSSCPPAEQWLGDVRDSEDVVSLAFHVDYWDYIGWRDAFADAAYTARQQALAARGSGIVYTPEFALDGREWRRGAGASLPPPGAAPFALELRVRPGAAIAAELAPVDGARDAARAQAWFALTESALVRRIGAGENRGRTLRHDHVVRALAGPLPLAAAQAVLRAPADLVGDNAAVVAFVTDARDGHVLQVLDAPLAACGGAR